MCAQVRSTAAAEKVIAAMDAFRDEYDMQLFMKRSKWSRATYGDEDFHYDRVAGYGGI